MEPKKNNLRRTTTFLVMMIASVSLYAQGDFYKGFDASVGVRSATISSEHPEINKEVLVTEGGSAGFVFGTSQVLTRARAGFYYSSNSVAKTVDLFESTIGANAYIFALAGKSEQKFQAYVSADLRYNQYKFAGDYLREDARSINYSRTQDTYVGKLHQMSACLGVGAEYRFINEYDFLAAYFEVKYARPFDDRSSAPQFSETHTTSPVIFNLGVRFGKIK